MRKTKFPPYGFRQLLGRAPNFDMTKQGDPLELEYDENLFSLLTKVQREVNNEFKYYSDVGDYWDHEPEMHTWKGWLTGKFYTRRYGDCEDYSLVKYGRLLGEGIPPEAMRLVLCQYKNVYHLVLAVTTKKGTFILDNRIKPVFWMSKDGNRFYDWLMWSVPGQFMWESLEDI